MTPLNLAQEMARHSILSDRFKPVPEQYLTRAGRDVKVRCVCGAKSDLRFGQLASCNCGRLFWAGSKVYAAPPPEAAESHDCEAARYTLPGGTTIVADYCRECMGDL